MLPIRRSPRRGEAGLTLAEMLVALMLIGLIAVLTAPVMPFPGRTLALDRAATGVRDTLRGARDAALAEGDRRAAVFDLSARSAQGPGGAVFALPKGVEIAVTGAADERLGADRLKIAFLPDGSATGGRVRLSEGGDVTVITVDWLTGGIHVAR